MRKNSVLNSILRDRQSTTALSVPRSARPHDNSLLLKLYPGKAVPIAAAGLHREDAVAAGRLSVTVEMSETAEVLINPVQVRVSAYLVPWLAFDRFNGRDDFEAAYSKVPLEEGGDVKPFVETMARGVEGDYPVLDALGLHAKSDQQVSTMYLEAYNKIINYRNTNLSLELPERDRLQTDLAPAIRDRGRHRNIVPTFEEAAMEAVIDIDLTGSGRLPVKGVGIYPDTVGFGTTKQPFVTEDDGAVKDDFEKSMVVGETGHPELYIEQNDLGRPDVRVEMDDQSFSFSLASIERAKKMQFFANLRKRYAGLDDDAIINKLMDGIRMPEKMFEQPIYLGSETSAFGFSKRYATDSDNLDQTVVQGATMVDMQLATPRINPGGVLMFIAEIQPEQLFERQPDPFLVETDVDNYPQFIRDDGDEQKVDRVYNKEIDTAHTDPDGLFGYGPMNGRWMVQAPRIGTGYFVPAPTTTFDENRNRIWDTTPADPALGQDWYLCGDVSTDVFEYTETEPFEISGRLSLLVTGNTVFGRPLIEGDGDYDKISERIPSPDDQISQEADAS